MFTFQKKYVLFTLVLFMVEVYIALYVHDTIIRPYVGDLLVVILIYCFCKIFLRIGVKWLALAVLLFAYLIEYLQYINFIKWLGLENNNLANVVLGNSFEWIDMLAYTLGAVLVIVIETNYTAKK
ncbi:MAG: DUF2809 domain-containing protein [Bacteroidota bacterium]